MGVKTLYVLAFFHPDGAFDYLSHFSESDWDLRDFEIRILRKERRKTAVLELIADERDDWRRTLEWELRSTDNVYYVAEFDADGLEMWTGISRFVTASENLTDARRYEERIKKDPAIRWTAVLEFSSCVDVQRVFEGM